MDKPISSEEKLLKHIRKKGSPAPENVTIVEAPVGEKEFKSDAPSQPKTPIDALGKFTKFLIILSIVLLVYIVLKGFVIKKDRIADLGMSQTIKTEETSPKKDIVVETPYSVYEEKFSERDIFDTSFYKAQGQPTQANPIATAVNPTTHYKLVGVILDDTAQAIIEDVRSNQTLFVYEGDKIDDIIVEKIEEGRITLKYQDQLFEVEN